MAERQETVTSMPSVLDFAQAQDNRSMQSPKIVCTPPNPGIYASFAERKAQMPRSSPLTIVHGDHNMRDIDRPPPGDVGTRTPKTPANPSLSHQKSAYFEEAFAVKDVHPAKARVRSEAIVMADVKTNVIIHDEFDFITALSYHLSTRYQRPISSIVVTLQHGACMLFGGTFDPAYVMSIFALPSELQPTTNKRNAALIQKHMLEAVGVVPSRGFLRFIPTSEEHTAWNGKTLAGEIHDLSQGAGASTEETLGEGISSRTKSKRGLSVRGFGAVKSAPTTTLSAEEPTCSPRMGAFERTSQHPTEHQAEDQLLTPAKAPKRSKSLMALVFGGR